MSRKKMNEVTNMLRSPREAREAVEAVEAEEPEEAQEAEEAHKVCHAPECGARIAGGLHGAVYTHATKSDKVVKLFYDESDADLEFRAYKVMNLVSESDPSFRSLRAKKIEGSQTLMEIDKFKTVMRKYMGQDKKRDRDRALLTKPKPRRKERRTARTARPARPHCCRRTSRNASEQGNKTGSAQNTSSTSLSN